VRTRIETIPNGVDLDRFHPVASAADEDERSARRETLGIAADELAIATVGAVMPRKGHEVVLEAWLGLAKRFPTAHLLLIGPRADRHDPKLQGFRRRLEDLVASSGASDRIHFVGMAHDVEAYLRAADVFVLASQREGLPNSMLEAMATGLPCVTTPFIGISARIGQPEKHYLLADRRAHALEAALARLLENPSLRKALGVAACRWIVDTLDLERSLDRYAALYEELVASRSG
jgi:glycosyltransferase involved in cell wall biosynthesis